MSIPKSYLELLPAVDVKDGRAVFMALHLKSLLIFKNQEPSGYTLLI